MTPRRWLAPAVIAWACLALVACREPIPADYSQYTGHWRGDGVRLVLSLPPGPAGSGTLTLDWVRPTLSGAPS